MSAPIRTEAAASSDVGNVRSHNEDSYLCAAPLFLVADGMGGYEAGERASAAVLEPFSRQTADHVDTDVMRRLYAEAGERVLALSDVGPSGAGTTLSGVGIASEGDRGYWLVINVGDSRTYLWRGGVLEQVTVDHSMVQELVDVGELTAEQAAKDPRRNVVTRAIGAGAVSDPDFWLLPAATGDRLLICSDGLTGELSPVDLARILGSEPDAESAAARLVSEAKARAGRDNITALVVDAVEVRGHDADEDGTDGDTLPRVQVAEQ